MGLVRPWHLGVLCLLTIVLIVSLLVGVVIGRRGK
jgi:hypothetical protein